MELRLKNKIWQLKNWVGILLVFVAAGAVDAQTCNSAIYKSAPDSRYVDNNNSTVTDQQTELMWQKCPVGLSGNDCTIGDATPMDWGQALEYSANFNSGAGFAGFSDWRLPNIRELRSLVEVACFSPAINITAFPNTDNNFYWSSSPAPVTLFDNNLTWGVAFGDGDPGSEGRGWNNSDYGYGDYYHVIRLVRTKQ